ncbi:hypothetical protein CPA45_18345 [Vreelandella nigrificans]|uniref:Uncharacterized protein n=1 Tax=Vreelandella nigrificans TaxID=2042704 RepID=A0A2A4HIP1_9GAMM|nr:hypothetical protein CPA45_18345 [Halomonas nigrificans]
MYALIACGNEQGERLRAGDSWQTNAPAPLRDAPAGALTLTPRYKAHQSSYAHKPANRGGTKNPQH